MPSEAFVGPPSASRLTSSQGPARRRLYLVLRCALGLLCIGVTPSSAATPFVVDAWRFGTPESNATLRYCVDARDPDSPVARRIAAAVAAALLLRAEEFLIGNDPRPQDM